jgi:hypothetical protein
MRKILTLFGMLLSLATFATPASSTYGQSSIHISSAAYDEYEIRVDGRSYRLNNNDLRLDNVNSGTHQLEVYRVQRGSLGGIFGSKNNAVSVYNNRINVMQNEQLEVMIDRSGNVNVSRYNNGTYGNNGSYGNNNGGYGNNNNNYGAGTIRIQSSSNEQYDVRIDGKSYRLTNNGLYFDNVNSAVHTIEVYRAQSGLGGIFGGKSNANLLFSRSVNISNGEEILVNVNNNGNVTLRENGGYNNNNGGYNNNDGRYNNNKGNNGKGHAYGKYKNKKDKNNKNRDDDDDRDWKNNNRY